MNIRVPAFGLAIVMAASLTGCASEDASFSSGAGNYGLPPGASAPLPWNGTGGSGGAAGMPAPPSNAGDRYTAPGTNPFVLTEQDPFSTFAVDVDTASYDIFRRDLNLNVLPQPASVRLEEYVNSFSYDYPAPAEREETPFRISVAASGQVFDRPSVLLRVGIQGKKPPPFQKRPANLVFLVDVSGSMDAPNKLPLVRTLLLNAPRSSSPRTRSPS
jgi:Ca-activated chloride channel homolog